MKDGRGKGGQHPSHDHVRSPSTCQPSLHLCNKLKLTAEEMKTLKLGVSILCQPADYTHTHTHPFNGPLSGTTRVSRYQKGETNLDFTQARDSEWQWHQLGHMQVCTSLQTDNHTSTPPLTFLQAGCPSCCPTNSVKALKAIALKAITHGLHM